MESRCARALEAFEAERKRCGWPMPVSDAGHRCGRRCDWWCFSSDRSMYVCRYTGRLHACTRDLCPGPFVETLESMRVCCVTGQEHERSHSQLSFHEMERYSYALARPTPYRKKQATPRQSGVWTMQDERLLTRMLLQCFRPLPRTGPSEKEDETPRESRAEDFVNRCRRIHSGLPKPLRPEPRKFVFALAIWLRESPRKSELSVFFQKHLLPTTTLQALFPKELRKLSKAQKRLLTCMQGESRSLFTAQEIPLDQALPV